MCRMLRFLWPFRRSCYKHLRVGRTSCSDWMFLVSVRCTLYIYALQYTIFPAISTFNSIPQCAHCVSSTPLAHLEAFRPPADGYSGKLRKKAACSFRTSLGYSQYTKYKLKRPSHIFVSLWTRRAHIKDPQTNQPSRVSPAPSPDRARTTRPELSRTALGLS